MTTSTLLDEHALERLNAQAKAESAARTYLLTGEELEKKRALALAFAKTLNCHTFETTHTCECPVCTRIERGIHPDVKWYGADEDASSIKIAEVRDFKSWLALKPYEARMKVFIFEGADRLTAEAQNALLKSLEEPPPGNVIVLLVDHTRFLFDTIVSRAIQIRVSPYSKSEVTQILTKAGISEREAEFLARVSNNNLTLAREGAKEKWFQTRSEWLTRLSQDPVAFLESFHSAKRPQILAVFDFLTELFRDCLVYQATGETESLIYPEILKLKSAIEQNSFQFSADQLEKVIELRNSLDANANAKLCLTQAEILFEHFFGR